MDLTDTEGLKHIQYNVFERRLTDRINFYDWKLSYQGDAEEFKILHGKT